MRIAARWTYRVQATLGRERTPILRSLVADVMVDVAEVGVDEARVVLDCSHANGFDDRRRYVYRAFGGSLYAPANVPAAAGRDHAAWLRLSLSTIPERVDGSGRVASCFPSTQEACPGLMLADPEAAARARSEAFADAQSRFLLVDGQAWVRSPEPRLALLVNDRLGRVSCSVVDDNLFPHEVGFDRLEDVPEVARMILDAQVPLGAARGRTAIPEVGTLDPSAFRFPSEVRSLVVSSNGFRDEMSKRALEMGRDHVLAYVDLRDARQAAKDHVVARAGDERAVGDALDRALTRAQAHFKPSRFVRTGVEMSRTRLRAARARWDVQDRALENEEGEDAAVAVGFD